MTVRDNRREPTIAEFRSWPTLLVTYYVLVALIVVTLAGYRITSWQTWLVLVVLILLPLPFQQKLRSVHSIEVSETGIRYSALFSRLDVEAGWKDVLDVKREPGEGENTIVVCTSGRFCVDYVRDKERLLRLIYDRAPNVKFHVGVAVPPKPDIKG